MTEEERLKQMQILREKIATQIGNVPSGLGGMYRTDADRSLEDILRGQNRMNPQFDRMLNGQRNIAPPPEMPKNLTPEQQDKWIWEWTVQHRPQWAREKIGTI